jgi:hypothetical protein
MKRTVTHLQIYKPGVMGGVVNTTLCGRVQNGGDYNTTNQLAEVTCHFCKRDIALESARFVKWHGWNPPSES